MRYLNTRESFLKNFKEIKIEKDILSSYNKDEIINEAFENDITFGGSLLGRLINSTIRKAKIQYNYYRVKSIARKIEDELLGLISDSFTDEQKKGVKLITAKMALLAMYQTVFDLDSTGKEISDDKKLSEEKKINALLGEEEVQLYGTTVSSGNKGLIKLAEEYINLLSDDDKIGNDNKATLLSKLKQFEEELAGLKKYYQEKNNFSDDVVYLLQLTSNINKDYKEMQDEEEEADEDEEEEETKPEEKTNLTKDKLVVGKWYKFTNKEGKVWLVKLINTEHSVQKGVDKDWLTKDDVIDSRIKLDKNVVYIAQQKESGENFTGELMPTGIAVLISRLEELPEQPKKQAATNPVPKKLTKDDIQVNKVYHYIDSKNQKKTVKVLNKDFQIDIKNNKQLSKLADPSDVFVGLVDKNGKITNTYTVKFDILQERRLLSNFDSFFNNYILEDATPISNTGGTASNTQTSSPEEKAESEISDILDKLSEEKLEGYINDDKSNFSDFGKQIKEDNKLDDLEEEIFQLVEIIKKLNVVFEKNKSVLNKINSSENINNFIETYQKIKAFDMNKAGDLKESWTKVWKEDQKNWTVTQEDIKLSESIDNSKYTLNLTDERGKNRIVNIVELFGKAYSCFATQLIPSGRPGGRISNKTRNEYVYIGAGTPQEGSETQGPGAGPWASIKVFTAFSEAIGQFFAEEKFRKIFDSGGIKLASGKTAEGNVLTEFMRDMTDESKIKNFTTRRAEFLTKYFDLKTKISDAEPGGYGTKINKEDSDGSEIYWESERKFDASNLKPGNFIVIDFEIKPEGKEKKSEIIMGEVLGVKNNRLAFKFQAGSISIPNFYAPYSLTDESKFGLESHSKREVWFGVINLPIDTADKSWQNMVYFASSKDNVLLNVTIHVIRPAKQIKAGKPSRTRERTGLGILYRYLDGKEEILMAKNPSKADNSLISKDKSLTGEQVFNKLNNELDKLEAPDKKFKYELKETLRKN